MRPKVALTLRLLRVLRPKRGVPRIGKGRRLALRRVGRRVPSRLMVALKL